MNPRYLILLTTLAFLGFSSSALMAKPIKCDIWPNCPNPNPNPEPGVVYTARLTAGGFVFTLGELTDLTANGKGTALSGPDPLSMDIWGFDDDPEGPSLYDADAWDHIFYGCLSLVTPDSSNSGALHITSFDVAADNWRINHIGAKGAPGHVYIVMRNLENITQVLLPQYSNADFDFDLHGDVIQVDGKDQLFPPAAGTTSTFILDEYVLWGGVGGKEKIICNSDGRLPLDPPTTLEISAPPCND